MESASLQEIKLELKNLSDKELAELCVRLARYKKDNKSFLSYLLFQSQNQIGFVVQLKLEIDQFFAEIDELRNIYFIKKSLRKILRFINQYCKYMGDKAITADLLLYFCRKVKASKIPLHQSLTLENIFNAQIKKIRTLTSGLHEDLQSDYLRELEELVE